MKIDESLSEVFDVEPMEVKSGELITSSGDVIVPDQPKDEKIEYDYEKTRGNLHALLQSGQDALMHALEVAKASEHPRAFEVVGNLMKQLSDVNAQLLDLHEKKQKLDIPKGKQEETGNTKQVTNNNAIFVGSTADLNKMLQNMNKGN